jgi:hypothetical protein
MAPKRKERSGSCNELGKEVHVSDRLACGGSCASVGTSVGVDESTVRTVCDNENSIKQMNKARGKLFSPVSRAQWPCQPNRLPCGLWRRSAAAWLLGPRVRISQTARMFVSCGCRVLCRQRPNRRADHSFRGFLPRARARVCVCVCVCVCQCRCCKNLKYKQPLPNFGSCVTKRTAMAMELTDLINGRAGWPIRS